MHQERQGYWLTIAKPACMMNTSAPHDSRYNVLSSLEKSVKREAVIAFRSVSVEFMLPSDVESWATVPARSELGMALHMLVTMPAAPGLW